MPFMLKKIGEGFKHTTKLGERSIKLSLATVVYAMPFEDLSKIYLFKGSKAPSSADYTIYGLVKSLEK